MANEAAPFFPSPKNSAFLYSKTAKSLQVRAAPRPSEMHIARRIFFRFSNLHRLPSHKTLLPCFAATVFIGLCASVALAQQKQTPDASQNLELSRPVRPWEFLS